MQSVHGGQFSHKRWERFIQSRAAVGTGISFPEIEVELCNIPCLMDTMEEEEEDRLRREGMAADAVMTKYQSLVNYGETLITRKLA